METEKELLLTAKRLVWALSSASAGLFKNHFNISYSTAGNLIDQLELERFVSPMFEDKPRTVFLEKLDLLFLEEK